MVIDIFANILHPKDTGPFMVIASAFLRDPNDPDATLPQRIGNAATLEEAERLRAELAKALRRFLREKGHQVGEVFLR